MNSSELESCVRDLVARFGEEEVANTSSWLVRGTDTECALCGLPSRALAEHFAQRLKESCGAETFILEPRPYAPHYCVISVATVVKAHPGEKKAETRISR